jgi:hypothetical protein
MPLGKPPVTPLSRLELRPLAERIDAIRQRLGALDAEVTALRAIADASTSAQQLLNLQRALLQLTERVSALEALLGAVDTITLAAAETVALFAVVVPAGPNQCITADPADPTQIHAALGIALNGGAPGTPIQIQRRGPLTLPVGGLEEGRQVFAGPDGSITQDPSYAPFVIPVGVATSSTTIWISPELALLRDSSIYPDPFELAMPITLQLLQEATAGFSELLSQPDGFVVLSGGVLVTRVLQSDGSIDITNPDGSGGDPVFSIATTPTDLTADLEKIWVKYARTPVPGEEIDRSSTELLERAWVRW